MPQLIVLIIILYFLFETISKIAIPVLVIITGIILYRIILHVYVEHYFKSNEFQKLKDSIKDNTRKCNELNAHIEELKKAYIEIETTDYGNANYYDNNSNFNFKRPNINKIANNNHTYNCSLSVCRNAKNQPFKYFCKYFNINCDEKTLEKFETVFNDFAAVEQGKGLLLKERDTILYKITNQVPTIIYKKYKQRLIQELGFNPINMSNVYCPKYSFVYVSAGGNSSMRCDIFFDANKLERFIHYLADIIKFRQSIAGQRALMTSALREKIKQRDSYTCKHCGASLNNEPNLLLEIDHIIPLSKGGITCESNLQTLCWRCNRKKGNKI